ncbi:MAG TPA: hypothetical protein VG722_03075 [Tepidisphaeraceae bacterium]|nr:hypothetical protein [Tepidisphaeraceae bacterium]
MKRTIQIPCVFVLAVLVAPAMGATPTTRPARSADEIDLAYRKAVMTINADYRKKLEAAENERIAGYQALLQAALAKKEFDVAAHLRVQIEDMRSRFHLLVPAEVEAHAEALDALEKKLKGTRWQWGQDDQITFQGDNTVGNRGWTSRGLVTTWKVIDDNIVMFYIQRGRNDDRYAFLIFSPKLDSYTGLSFGGGKMPAHNLELPSDVPSPK